MLEFNGENGDWLLMGTGFFQGDWRCSQHLEMLVAQLSEYTEKCWTVYFKLITHKYVNYISIKLFENKKQQKEQWYTRPETFQSCTRQRI